jgi:hypothetical protein
MHASAFEHMLHRFGRSFGSLNCEVGAALDWLRRLWRLESFSRKRSLPDQPGKWFKRSSTPLPVIIPPITDYLSSAYANVVEQTETTEQIHNP